MQDTGRLAFPSPRALHNQRGEGDSLRSTLLLGVHVLGFRGCICRGRCQGVLASRCQALCPLGCRDGNVESGRRACKAWNKNVSRPSPRSHFPGLCGRRRSVFLFWLQASHVKPPCQPVSDSMMSLGSFPSGQAHCSVVREAVHDCIALGAPTISHRIGNP